MHYKKLIEAHRLFYGGFEYRAPYYDDYMQSKNWKEWASDSVSIAEIEKLFHFIHKWDYHFKGKPEVFKKTYEYVYPIIEQLGHEKIEDSNLNDENLRRKIRYVFDRVADCPGTGRYESTDASKILHTLLPNFIVMWDNKIRDGMSVGKRGISYANVFLPKVQEELEEAIRTCVDERGLTRVGAIAYIREQCDGKTLAKLADEYNYMKYTKGHPSLQLGVSIINKAQTSTYIGKAVSLLQATVDLYSSFNIELSDLGGISSNFRRLSKEEKELEKRQLTEKVEKGKIPTDKPSSLAQDFYRQIQEIKREAMSLRVPEECDLIHSCLISTISYFETSIDNLAKALEGGNQGFLNPALTYANTAIKYVERTTNLMEKAKEK